MPAFKTLDDLNGIAGKRVLVRVDLNVPVKDGKVTDATRIERVAPTILELSEKGAKVILLAHFGRPKDGPSADLSLSLIAPDVSKVLGKPVATATDSIGDDAAAAVAKMKDGDILLLENTRFYKGEEKNDAEVVDQEERAEAETIAVIAGRTWDSVRNQRELPCAILEAAELAAGARAGFEAIQNLVCGCGPPVRSPRDGPP